MQEGRGKGGKAPHHLELFWGMKFTTWSFFYRLLDLFARLQS